MLTPVHEVVGTFPTATAVEEAAEELMSRGFDRAGLSLVGTREAVEEKLGAGRLHAAELADDPRTPRIAYMDHHELALGQGAVVAALVYVAGGLTMIGSLASAEDWRTAVLLGALAALAGGAVGAFAARRLGLLTARKIDDELARGGVLLWVRTAGERSAAIAMEVLARHGARDVHGHGADASR